MMRTQPLPNCWASGGQQARPANQDDDGDLVVFLVDGAPSGPVGHAFAQQAGGAAASAPGSA